MPTTVRLTPFYTGHILRETQVTSALGSHAIRTALNDRTHFETIVISEAEDLAFMPKHFPSVSKVHQSREFAPVCSDSLRDLTL